MATTEPVSPVELELACVRDELLRMSEGRWLFEDPRHTIYKRCHIIILRPIGGGPGVWRAGTGYVETHQGWSITTSFEDHGVIHDWDPSWCWARAPGDRLGPPL